MAKRLYLYFILSLFIASSSQALQCRSLLNSNKGEFAGRITLDGSGGKSAFYNPNHKIIEVPLSDGEKLVRKLNKNFSPDLQQKVVSEDKTTVPKKRNTSLLREMSERLGSKWRVQHPLSGGQSHFILTRYGKTFYILQGGPVRVKGKIRLRQHFRKDRTASPEHATPLYPGLISLEIKLDNAALDQKGNLAISENSVFRPKIFIRDKHIAEIKRLLKNKKPLNDIITDIQSLEIDGKPVNSGEEVKALISTLRQLSKQDSNLLDIQEVISFERTSFQGRSRHSNSVYDLSIDTNVMLYSVSKKTDSCCDLKKFLTQKPTSELPPKDSYITLRTSQEKDHPPLAELEDLKTILRSHQREGESHIQRGKLSTFMHYLNGFYHDSNDFLKEKGTLFWLIKGSSFLPQPPRRKSLTENGLIEVAIPFETSNGVHRLLISYEPFIDHERVRTSYISKIKIINTLGDEVSFKSTALLRRLKRRSQTRPFQYLVVEGSPILIKSKLDSKELEDYRKFFSEFYKDFSKNEMNPREIESLKFINSIRSLQRYYLKLRVLNLINYIKSRLHRVTFQLIYTAIIYFGLEQFTSNQPVVLPDAKYIEVQMENGTSQTYKADTYEEVPKTGATTAPLHQEVFDLKEPDLPDEDQVD